MINISVCICAYNEQENIGRTIQSLINQEKNLIHIDEIITVSSSTDDTNNIVNDLSKGDGRIKLIVEKERRGKAAAINSFIQVAKNDICVLIGADIIPESNAIEQLCLPFVKEEDRIGMTGARVIPSNKKTSFLGFMGNTEWEMAHRLCLISPKLGECIAFKKTIDHTVSNLDPHTAVDEAYIEYKVTTNGYKLKYVPSAIVYNRTSETLSDAIKQRRRINAGHIHLKETTHYEVSSMDMNIKGKLALGIYYDYLRFTFWMPIVVLLESYSILLGLIDYKLLKKNPYIWKISKSTKGAITKEVYQDI